MRGFLRIASWPLSHETAARRVHGGDGQELDVDRSSRSGSDGRHDELAAVALAIPVLFPLPSDHAHAFMSFCHARFSRPEPSLGSGLKRRKGNAEAKRAFDCRYPERRHPMKRLLAVRGHRYFRWNDNVVLVDPGTRQVVQIIE
jgi:hypothetical protein